MFWNLVIVFVVIGFAGYTFLSSRKKEEKNDFNPAFSYQLVKNGAILLDVRSKSEYDSGSIKNAVHIPYSDIRKQKDFIKNLTKNNQNQPIVVYCQSGRRSEIAKEELKNLGYTQVINHGGIDSWLEQNKD